ncbi:hypothetical protein [Paraburkholderia dinghuensis]|uniref:Uncharacterized protein n=1 Tax=Paraburkholderia dinghuensis TaxID=2305225 RepID=A0A3N6PY74_9BURK|nr:hypothetical protein [Paraburkholderia dinghuensis]RQH05006.1 hypothetical protein D1Y85_16485 [Paraburkholderia dinghuensis]
MKGNDEVTTSYLEMTIRIDADAHPRLHAYLLAREPGKRRAAALKRLAEDALLLGDSAAPAAARGATNHRSARDEAAPNPPGVMASDVRSSLAQFLPGGKP